MPDTGNFIWKVSKLSFAGKTSIGEMAGTRKDGYVKIGCDQRQYRAHRLAWLFMTGSFPAKGFEIDHINGDRDDNSWKNLRLVTRSQNNMNANPSVKNNSGTKGVSFRKDINKWHARIQVQKNILLLGNFDSKESAVAARQEAEIKYFRGYVRNL